MPLRNDLALALAALLAVACGAPRAAPTRDVPGMIGQPGGRFWTRGRGTLEDTGAYVGVDAFYLDATEVTVAGYAACVNAGRCRPAGARSERVDVKGPARAALDAACNQDRPERAGDPVNCVAFPDARDYCAFAGKRLPTEDEWEWAARNGERATAYPWGDQAPGARACWSGEGSGEAAPRAGTCTVGSHPAGDSAAGVEDLAGNVAEWTSTGDLIHTDSRGRGGYPVRIVRGGRYLDAGASALRADARAKRVELQRSPDLGFRCAKDP